MLGPMAKSSRILVLCSVVIAAALVSGSRPAGAQQPTCVTLCQQKVDACAGQCEALASSVYRDPASLQECQLACAKGLFVCCVEHCTQTGEVVEDDYGIAAENPDRIPAAPKKAK